MTFVFVCGGKLCIHHLGDVAAAGLRIKLPQRRKFSIAVWKLIRHRLLQIIASWKFRQGYKKMTTYCKIVKLCPQSIPEIFLIFLSIWNIQTSTICHIELSPSLRMSPKEQTCDLSNVCAFDSVPVRGGCIPSGAAASAHQIRNHRPLIRRPWLQHFSFLHATAGGANSQSRIQTA